MTSNPEQISDMIKKIVAENVHVPQTGLVVRRYESGRVMETISRLRDGDFLHEIHLDQESYVCDMGPG